MKPISKKDLIEAFRLIDSAPLRCSSMLMDEQTWKNLTWKECKSCGGMRHPDYLHSPEDCDLWRVRAVMED